MKLKKPLPEGNWLFSGNFQDPGWSGVILIMAIFGNLPTTNVLAGKIRSPSSVSTIEEFSIGLVSERYFVPNHSITLSFQHFYAIFLYRQMARLKTTMPNTVIERNSR